MGGGTVESVKTYEGIKVDWRKSGPKSKKNKITSGNSPGRSKKKKVCVGKKKKSHPMTTGVGR